VSVSHFETGHRFPNAESLRRLADALGVSADYLLGRVRDPAGGDIIGVDPEVAVLWRLFQGMSERARDQVTQMVAIVDAVDRKRRRSREPKP
jgi:transcriptional regulator with XRE-family HTH domain